MPFGKTLGVFSKKDDKRSSWGQNTEVAGEPSSTPSTLSQADVEKEQVNKSDDVEESSTSKPVTEMEEKILPNLGGAEVTNEPPVDEKHGESIPDDIVYPTGAKLAIISVALCLSVFLVALVSNSFLKLLVVCQRCSPPCTNTPQYTDVLIFYEGQYDHCCGDPPYHRPVPRPR